MLIKPFGPEIFHTSLSEDLSDELYQICIKHQNDLTKRYNRALTGWLHKEINIFSDIQDRILPALTDIVLKYLNSCTVPKLVSFTKRDISCRASWANIQEPNEFHPIHNHMLDDIVVVCFPKVELNSTCPYRTQDPVRPGTLTFTYGENLRNFGTTAYSVVPKTGDVFVFPGGLKHYTYPVFDDDIRISTSTNFAFTEYYDVGKN
jgi:hypothetical protein